MGIGMRRKKNRTLKNDAVSEEQNHFLLDLIETKITHGKLSRILPPPVGLNYEINVMQESLI
jgi:hypothetical protein